MPGSELPPSLRDRYRLLRRGPVALLVRRDWEAALPVEALLDGAPVEQWGSPVAHALTGRGQLHVLATARGELVAKVQARGGLAGGVLREAFLDERRGWREAEAAETLLARGIRTPVVVAARSVRVGPLLHRLELATARVPSRGDLLEALRAGALPLPVLAAAAGRTVRRAHDAGLAHRDLQAKNLLVPQDFDPAGADGTRGDLVVLDLDRCRVGQPLPTPARIAGLARLARSLVKQGVLPLAPGAAARPGAMAACRDFVRAYGALPGLPPARLLAAIGAELRRTLALHVAGWRRAGGPLARKGERPEDR